MNLAYCTICEPPCVVATNFSESRTPIHVVRGKTHECKVITVAESPVKHGETAEAYLKRLAKENVALLE